MIRLMNPAASICWTNWQTKRAIVFFNRRGYVYATARPEHKRNAGFRPKMHHRTAQAFAYLHEQPDSDYAPHSAENYRNQPDGADLLLNPELIRKHFPYLNDKTVAALHARRCGCPVAAIRHGDARSGTGTRRTVCQWT